MKITITCMYRREAVLFLYLTGGFLVRHIRRSWKHVSLCVPISLIPRLFSVMASSQRRYNMLASDRKCSSISRVVPVKSDKYRHTMEHVRFNYVRGCQRKYTSLEGEWMPCVLPWQFMPRACYIEDILLKVRTYGSIKKQHVTGVYHLTTSPLNVYQGLITFVLTYAPTVFIIVSPFGCAAGKFGRLKFGSFIILLMIQRWIKPTLWTRNSAIVKGMIIPYYSQVIHVHCDVSVENDINHIQTPDDYHSSACRTTQSMFLQRGTWCPPTP